MCHSLKFISEASHFNLLFFCVFNSYLLGLQPPFTVSFFFWNFRFAIEVALHLRWLTTEKFQNNETVKVVVYQVKMSSKHKNKKLRWLESDVNFKLLHTGCRIAHGMT